MRRRSVLMIKRRIWVAGHKGMVGSAITRHLQGRGDEVLKVDRSVVDLRNQISVEVWLKQNRPDAIVFAAAMVGGIYANDLLPRRFHIRQSGDRNEHHPFRPRRWRRPLVVFGVFLRLSEIRPAADQGGVAADRAVGADQ